MVSRGIRVLPALIPFTPLYPGFCLRINCFLRGFLIMIHIFIVIIFISVLIILIIVFFFAHRLIV